MNEIDAIKHYILIGKDANKYMKLPYNFNIDDYKKLNPDIFLKNNLLTEKEIINHFITYGIHENRMIEIQKINYCKRILCICHVGTSGIFQKIEKYIENFNLYKTFKSGF